MIKVVLVRHGQSQWNLENRFTGWTDVPLSTLGEQEAIDAGKLLAETKMKFEKAYTSYLKRAIDTLSLIESQLNYSFPIEKFWELNERHYGALQGLNKAETAKEYGEGQVKLWRRDATTPPPLLSKEDKRNPAFDKLYEGLKNLPLGESLADTKIRVERCFTNVICKEMKNNKDYLIVAHGNSLRALIQFLDNISNVDIVNLEIPTGKPIVYELDENFKAIKHYYL